MLVVSNTSPLSNLAIVDHLDLLRERYGRVIVPERVKLELDALSHAAGKSRIEKAYSEGWLLTQRLPDYTLTAQLGTRVDAGEAEAIALAELLKADKLIIDDGLGRELARARGVAVVGLLGELLHAKLHGRIGSVGAIMDQLKAEARFFIRDDLRRLILHQAGEEHMPSSIT